MSVVSRLAAFVASLILLCHGSFAQSLAPVKVGTTRSLGDAGIFIAFEKGYFRTQGLDVELIEFQTALPMLSAVAIGQIDVGRGAQSAGLFNSFARGINVRLVADGSSLRPGGGYLALALRKDLADSIQSPRDLKGKVIAIAGASGTSEIILDLLMKQVGMSVADLEIRAIPIPDQLPALANKVIDGAIVLEPTMSAMVARNIAVRWKGGDEIYPNMQAGLLMFSPAFAERTDVASRFMVAYVKALRDYNEAFFHNTGRSEVVKILAQRTGQRDPSVVDRVVPAGLDPNGRINVQGLKSDQEWYASHGMIKTKINIDQFVDQSFVDHATKTLGQYAR